MRERRVAPNACATPSHYTDIVAIDPVASPRNGRIHALRSIGGRHTLKAYLDGQWWQFRPGDAEPVAFPLPGDTYLIGVVVGGKYGERFYRPGKPAAKRGGK